jgi:hypothetical protein
MIGRRFNKGNDTKCPVCDANQKLAHHPDFGWFALLWQNSRSVELTHG